MTNLIDFFDDVLEYESVTNKVCNVCKVAKPFSSFPKRSGQTYDGRCTDCKNVYFKELVRVKKSLNVPAMSQYCDCCGRENPKATGGTNFALDHHYDDEGNPMFRGWLCKQCNSGIGYLGDNIEGVYNAINYLLKTLPEDKTQNFFRTITESQKRIDNGRPIQRCDPVDTPKQKKRSRGRKAV